MLKIGVIGLGKMGFTHLLNASKFSNVQIVGVADASKKNLLKAESLGITNRYSDFSELLQLDLDAVLISLPNFLHLESVKIAMENGINVFVEKPLARNVDECKEIITAVDKSGRKLMIGHSMRFSSEVERMKAYLDDGALGQLEVVTLENIASGPFSHGDIPRPIPEWWFDREKVGGGALIDLGYHLIDLFRFFAGDCHLLSSALDYKYHLPLEDTAIVTVKADNSSTKGIIHVGWYEQVVFPKNNVRAILHGDHSYLSSEEFLPHNIYTYAAKEGIKNVFRKISGRKTRPLTYAPFSGGFKKELEHFFECLEKDLSPSVTALDGLKTTEIIEQVYNSIEKREAVM